MKFDRSNKFDFCYYGQVNSLRLKSTLALKWESKHLWEVTFILLAMVCVQQEALLGISSAHLSLSFEKKKLIYFHNDSKITLQ